MISKTENVRRSYQTATRRMGMSSRRDAASRSSKGMASLELAAGSLIMIGIVAMALNICFAMLSYGINDRACRDAARAAAQGTTATEAAQLANSIVKTYNSNNGILSPISVTGVTYNDFGGNPTADVSPSVTVSTSCTSRLPAPIEFVGSKIFGDSVLLKKTYTFPIVRFNFHI